MRLSSLTLAPFAIYVSLLLPAASSSTGDETVTLHVSTHGQSGWSGISAEPSPDGRDGPLPSLVAARDRIREIRGENSSVKATRYVVLIHEGDYLLERPFRLESQDSGTAGAPVIYRAADPEHRPRIRGSFDVSLGTLPADSEGLLRIPFSEANLQHPAEVRTAKRLGRRAPRFDLYHTGQRLPLARWPNKKQAGANPNDWAYIQKAPLKSRTEFTATHLPRGIAEQVDEIEVHVFSQPDWYDEIVECAAIDPASRAISLARKTHYDLTPGSRYFLQNSKAFLDAPGEWWFDKSSDSILLVPPEDNGDGLLHVAHSTNLLVLDAVSHVSIEGLCWEHSAADAVVMNDANACSFRDNIVRHTGGWGIKAETNGELEITGNEVHDTGLGGVHLTGGDRAQLTSARIRFSGNSVHHPGERVRCYFPAVEISGVGIQVTDNQIRDTPHSAIHFTGSLHVIARNVIERVCSETNDTGAIYAGRSWTSRGTVISENVFRDIHGWRLENRRELEKDGRGSKAIYSTGDRVHAIYLDDLLEGTTVRNNVFWRIDSDAIHIGGGSYNTIVDNLFINCRGALFLAQRATFSTQAGEAERYDHPGSPYHDAFPEFAGRAANMPLVPQHVTFSGNVLIETSRAYRILSMAAANDFNHNTFVGTAPALVATIGQKPSRKRVIDWDDWRAEGFDRQSTIVTSTDSALPDQIDKWIARSRPSDPALSIAKGSLSTSTLHMLHNVERLVVPLTNDGR